MLEKRMEPADIKKAYVRDGFWDRYTGKVPERIIPYQWDMMNDRIQAFINYICIIVNRYDN